MDSRTRLPDRISANWSPLIDSMVNFNYILDRGVNPVNLIEIPFVTDWLQNGNQSVDIDAGDAFAHAYHGIVDRSAERIREHPVLQALLAQPHWSREDRVLWEQTISGIVDQEHAATPGLSQYRSTSVQGDNPIATRRPSLLNELSSDIENNTVLLEHDCESMSMVEGMALQQMERLFLPEAAENDSFRRQGSYFYSVGVVNWNRESARIDNHAFILSSATGNLIEATASGSAYRSVDASFTDAINGQMMFTDQGNIYQVGAMTHGAALIYPTRDGLLDRMINARIERGELPDYDRLYEQLTTALRDNREALLAEGAPENVRNSLLMLERYHTAYANHQQYSTVQDSLMPAAVPGPPDPRHALSNLLRGDTYLQTLQWVRQTVPSSGKQDRLSAEDAACLIDKTFASLGFPFELEPDSKPASLIPGDTPSTPSTDNDRTR